MNKKLGQICSGLFDVDGQQGEIAVGGLSSDSRQVKPGYVFAALEGVNADGASFAAKAVEAGAVAIVAGPDSRIDVPGGVVVLRHENPRHALARMAANFYARQPGCVVAVTGTNGKSSVVAFVRQIWEAMGLCGASLGTVGVNWGGGEEKLAHTTPDPVTLHAMISQLSGRGISHLAVEASSHGLEQHRLDGLSLCAGAFTNFSRDHLDYHASEEDYFNAKMRLIDDLLEAGSPVVVNMDDKRAGEVIRRADRADLRVLQVGRKASDLRLDKIRPLGLGQELQITGGQGRYKVYLPLVGAFQAANALVAAGLVIASGGSEAVAIKVFENLKGARGRLELVDRTSAGAPVFVDYAHTPDALKTALEALRPFARGALKVVIGAGGDRDCGKRVLMGRAAARFADEVIVTDDNPRSENPAVIRKAILEGCPEATEIGDRAVAIDSAIRSLAPDDVLLVAGKGHEQGQIVGDRVLPFSDHEAVLAVTGGAAA